MKGGKRRVYCKPSNDAYFVFDWLENMLKFTLITKGMSHWFLISVFPPDRAIVGIPRCNQKRPPDKRKEGQFSPLLLQGCLLA